MTVQQSVFHYLSDSNGKYMKLPVSLCNTSNRLFSFTETPSGGEVYLQALDEEQV